MVRGESPHDGLHCDDLLDAAAEIDQLRAALAKIADPLILDVTGTGFERTLRMINAMVLIAKEALGRTENEHGGEQDADAG